MKAWILFDENNNFVSKCFDEKYANLETLGSDFDKSKCRYEICDCCDDDYVYYEDGEMKMKHANKFKTAKKAYKKVKNDYLKTKRDKTDLKIELQLCYDDYMLKKAEYKKAKLKKKEMVSRIKVF